MREMSLGTKGSPRMVSLTRFMRDMAPTMSPTSAELKNTFRNAKAKAAVSRAMGSQFRNRMSGWRSILPSMARTETGCAQSTNSVTTTLHARPSSIAVRRPTGLECRFKSLPASFQRIARARG